VPSKTLYFPNPRHLHQLYGGRDENLSLVEQTLGVKLVTREEWLKIDGPADAIARTETLFGHLNEARGQGVVIRTPDFERMVETFGRGDGAELRELFGEPLVIATNRRSIVPKTLGQKLYLQSIQKHPIVFGIGPAGTGKTYLAMAAAISALLKNEVQRVILTRPAVEAGEALGFLPGDLREKILPYLRPLYDAMHDMLDEEDVVRLTEKGVIEIAPLAYMRGRTLSHSFIVLDEAQNTTPETDDDVSHPARRGFAHGRDRRCHADRPSPFQVQRSPRSRPHSQQRSRNRFSLLQRRGRRAPSAGLENYRSLRTLQKPDGRVRWTGLIFSAMSLRRNLQLIRGGLLGPRHTRKAADTSAALEFLSKSRLVAILIFVVTVVAIVFISFVGVSTLNLPILPGQFATVRVEASASFNYVSQEKTRAARDALVDRVPPVYRLDFTPLQQFEVHIRDLLAQLEKFERDFPANAPTFANRQEALANLVDAFNAKGPYRVSPEDVVTLLAAGDAKLRFQLVESGLAALREIYTEGVHDSSLEQGGGANSVMIYQILRPNGEITQRPVQSLEQALTFLRINLAAEGTGRPVATALFRIFRNGITPNIIFDRDASHRRETEALKALKPVTVTVARGQTIIEPGERVTPEQYEMLMAHRQFLLDSGDTARDEGLRLFGRILLVLAMVMASVFYIRLEDRETLQSNGRLALLALVVIVNLALVRVTYSLLSLDFFQRNAGWASTVPYLAPTALAPLIVAILIDAGSAIFMALLISIFTGVIYGNRLDLLVLTFLASMVAIFGCRDVRKRSRVVSAAGAGGLIVAVFALLIGFVDHVPVPTLLQQMGAGLLIGLLTGILVVGVLPVLESLFKRTTDITLLELTDFNHPLLRLMQLEAPGTYHHSLVVAQLAENASNAIGANPLLARTCALFHDIGKTAKPEYFAENQRDTANPHDANNPSLSALIIKSHVKDGVELARKHKLPRAVIDVILQHHGTTLIRYFYERAKLGSVAPFPVSRAGHLDSASSKKADSREPFPGVAESTYRYDGPRPQFKESAVISLADAVEAASRSLRKVTPQHLGELIESVFRDRIWDGQLDEAPLTFAELAQIKSSFTFTLLNMLHSRVAYPSDERSAAEAKG